MTHLIQIEIIKKDVDMIKPNKNKVIRCMRSCLLWLGLLIIYLIVLDVYSLVIELNPKWLSPAEDTAKSRIYAILASLFGCLIYVDYVFFMSRHIVMKKRDWFFISIIPILTITSIGLAWLVAECVTI